MASISGKSGKPGAAREFDSPRGIATDDQGTSMSPIPAMDGADLRSRRRYIAHVGHLGKGPGEFYSPAALWIDPADALCRDTINHVCKS